MKGKEKNDLERFKEYPQQITPPPGLDAPAARLTRSCTAKRRRKKRSGGRRLVRRRLLPSLAILLVLLIPLCIGIPGMLTLDDEEGNYYLGEEVRYEQVNEEIEEFIKRNDLVLCYFDENYLSSSVAAYYLIENDKLVYLMQ